MHYTDAAAEHQMTMGGLQPSNLFNFLYIFSIIAQLKRLVSPVTPVSSLSQFT